MALACQKDSYLQTLTSHVKSCEPGVLEDIAGGKKQLLSCFEVILDDTVLFPEGGGQPDDRGTIDGVEVLAVRRRGADAIHYTPVPLDVGRQANVVVDWTRRWDHMQQHSGQHLITAVASLKFGFQTTSWCLGEKTSSIELDASEMTHVQMSDLEVAVNEKIRAGCEMFPTLYESKDDLQLLDVRTRGLPDDHVGAVRVVTIDGLEVNMCCGTHVSNLCHLQMIKLLTVEKGKKSRINLVFVAGDRVLKYLTACYEREKKFTQLLKGGPDDHIELLQKLQNSFRTTQKSAVTLLREAAKFEADKFKSMEHRPPYFILHKKEGDHEFMNILSNEIADENVLIFLTAGEDVGPGQFLLNGHEDAVTTLGPQVAEVLDGKGAGKKGRFQGKANKLQNRNLAENLLKDFCAQRQP